MSKHLYASGYGKTIDTLIFEDEKFCKTGRVMCENASFLCFHPTINILYAGVEKSDSAGFVVFEIDNESGKLTQIDKITTSGSGLCHVIATEKALYGACYNSGHVVAIKLLDDGKLHKVVNFIEHKGGCEHERQDGAHAHQVLVSPDEKWLVAVDLGTNSIHSYKINFDGSLAEDTVKISEFEKFAGPRHMVFKSKKEAYMLSELSNKVFKLTYNDGEFNCSDNISLAKIKAENMGAEIDFMPNTEFLFASIRGEDKIFCIDTSGDEMEILSEFDSAGKSPRMFSFSKDGKYLFTANQQSNKVVAFKMNKKTGENMGVMDEVGVEKVSFVKL